MSDRYQMSQMRGWRYVITDTHAKEIVWPIDGKSEGEFMCELLNKVEKLESELEAMQFDEQYPGDDA